MNFDTEKVSDRRRRQVTNIDVMHSNATISENLKWQLTNSQLNALAA